MLKQREEARRKEEEQAQQEQHMASVKREACCFVRNHLYMQICSSVVSQAFIMADDQQMLHCWTTFFFTQYDNTIHYKPVFRNSEKSNISTACSGFFLKQDFTT